MWKDFKNFLMRGNVLDLAVAVVIAGAFGLIIKSFVDDILMPPIGMLLGNVNFSELFYALDGKVYTTLAGAQEAGAPTINYGLFIMTIINFLIIAFVIFLIVRAINKSKEAEEEAPREPTTKECPCCFTTIPIKATRCPHCTTELG